jgi:hypothetical protein
VRSKIYRRLKAAPRCGLFELKAVLLELDLAAGGEAIGQSSQQRRCLGAAELALPLDLGHRTAVAGGYLLDTVRRKKRPHIAATTTASRGTPPPTTPSAASTIPTTATTAAAPPTITRRYALSSRRRRES